MHCLHTAFSRPCSHTNPPAHRTHLMIGISCLQKPALRHRTQLFFHLPCGHRMHSLHRQLGSTPCSHGPFTGALRLKSVHASGGGPFLAFELVAGGLVGCIAALGALDLAAGFFATVRVAPGLGCAATFFGFTAAFVGGGFGGGAGLALGFLALKLAGGSRELLSPRPDSRRFPLRRVCARVAAERASAVSVWASAAPRSTRTFSPRPGIGTRARAAGPSRSAVSWRQRESRPLPYRKSPIPPRARACVSSAWPTAAWRSRRTSSPPSSSS